MWLLGDTFEINSWLDLPTWWKKPCENNFLDENFRYNGETLVLNGDKDENLILNEYKKVEKWICGGPVSPPATGGG